MIQLCDFCFSTAHSSPTYAYHEEMKVLLHQLPKHNYLTLKYLISLLVLVTKNEPVNKMNAAAVGIVFGPNLLRWFSEWLSAFLIIELPSQYLLVPTTEWCMSWPQTVACYHTTLYGTVIRWMAGMEMGTEKSCGDEIMGIGWVWGKSARTWCNGDNLFYCVAV